MHLLFVFSEDFILRLLYIYNKSSLRAAWKLSERWLHAALHSFILKLKEDLSEARVQLMFVCFDWREGSEEVTIFRDVQKYRICHSERKLPALAVTQQDKQR